MFLFSKSNAWAIRDSCIEIYHTFLFLCMSPSFFLKKNLNILVLFCTTHVYPQYSVLIGAGFCVVVIVRLVERLPEWELGIFSCLFLAFSIPTNKWELLQNT